MEKLRCSLHECHPPPRRLRYRQQEYEWRRSHQKYLRTFTNQWIVLEGEEIVGHGEDPVQLVKQAREKGIDRPYVFYVEPPRPERVVKIGL
jgi:hypothetical protein